MSERFPGGIITKSPATPTGPYQTGAAPGIWTLDQQLQYQQQGVWPTAGLSPNYIEDVFSTWLYTGTGATQTITNGIDVSTQGGLVWIKSRSSGEYHNLFDTVRGAANVMFSNVTDASASSPTRLSSFNTTGFTVGSNSGTNANAATFASWTFRKQPKFFDVVTWTGNDASNRQISHNLGSVPGCIIARAYTSASDWSVYHRSLGNTKGLYLNLTQAQETNTQWGNTTPTSSVFTTNLNGAGNTYIAYLFAHDAGGFGLTGTDNVISCGSFTTDGSGNATVNLGYEPQWVMIKRSDNTSVWYMDDTMRGLDLTAFTRLLANTSAAESTSTPNYIAPSSTGFNLINGFSSAGSTWIYIAIRRGPMAVPTDATKVFKPVTYTGSAGNQSITGVGFPPDLFMANWRASPKGNFEDRLRGTDPYLQSTGTGAEATGSTNIVSYDMSGITLGVNNLNNKDGASFVGYFYQRAPSFFDEVCYTGDGTTNRSITHNLASIPEILIVRRRNSIGAWHVYSSGLISPLNSLLVLNSTNGEDNTGSPFWGVSSTNFSLPASGGGGLNTNGGTYVAYLFATCAGVSKVGSYTGNGTTQTINCGFTSGARFVLIKRTDATGDWYVYDTARGMTTLTDPYFLFNDTAAEVATLGSVTTVSTGFALNSTILAAINVNAGTYIFLAIA